MVAALKKGDKYKQKYHFTYYAEGYVLNIEDFKNENDIVNNCTGEDKNCLIKIIAGIE